MSCNMKGCRFDADPGYKVPMWKDDPNDVRPRPVCRWHYWINQLMERHGWVLPMPGAAVGIGYLVTVGHPTFLPETWLGTLAAMGLMFLLFMLSALAFMVPMVLVEAFYLRESGFRQTNIE